jgi:hypothetical protein
MNMLVVYDERDRYAAEIVATALRRSFTSGQIRCITCDQLTDGPLPPPAAVLINPPAEAAPLLAAVLATGGKALLLGRLPPVLGDLVGVNVLNEPPLDPALATAKVDHARHHDDSPAAIHYAAHPLALTSPLRQRALCRFDFQNEWNNLGFGRITADGSAWSLAAAAVNAGATPIAWIAVDKAPTPRLYAALRDAPCGAALWFNRAVGPVDSSEWRVVEVFLGDYRPDDLVCFPYLSEIPAGYAAAATMRLDCDEAVSTARPLFELYADSGTPLSLAIPTGQALGPDAIELMRDVARSGGSVVPHSVHHRVNWGGCYTEAAREAAQSKAALEQQVSGLGPVEYAVSPFHQNPIYAVHALADSGYAGFVGGIIAGDPEYLLGRAGQVPFIDSPLVSHSAQCMLHGDCFERYGRTVDTYQESFDNHRAGRSIFGYLDHPFSVRYQYGWADEASRLQAHGRLLAHIGRTSGVWRPNLRDALDFLRCRNAVSLHVEQGAHLRWHSCEDRNGNGRTPHLAASWKGRECVR